MISILMICLQGVQLQKELRMDEEELSNLSITLDRAQTDYEEMYTKMQELIETMEVTYTS